MSGKAGRSGRPPFVPDEKHRLTVTIMATCGMPHDRIASQITNPETGQPIDAKTLRKVFRRELTEGMETANAMVMQSLFKKATGTGPQSVTAAIFWLKCRAAWKPVDIIQHQGTPGMPIENVSAALDPIEAARRYQAVMGGGEDKPGGAA